jgi:Ni/Fe-hydrogenase subunit HybB-like protein
MTDKEHVVVVLLLSILVAVAVVAVVFHLAVHEQLKARISWHRVAFAGILFWLWYLAPGLSDDSALASVLSLIVP